MSLDFEKIFTTLISHFYIVAEVKGRGAITYLSKVNAALSNKDWQGYFMYGEKYILN